MYLRPQKTLGMAVQLAVQRRQARLLDYAILQFDFDKACGMVNAVTYA